MRRIENLLPKILADEEAMLNFAAAVCGVLGCRKGCPRFEQCQRLTTREAALHAALWAAEEIGGEAAYDKH